MKKRFSGPQILGKLRQADVLIGEGKTIADFILRIWCGFRIESGMTGGIKGRREERTPGETGG